MKLIDALELLRLPVPDDAPGLKIFLACGFTPLHLQTFLAAQLRKLIPQQNIEIKTGIFGDLVGNIERLAPSDFNSLIVIIEWGDLDPRLGIRSLGGWRPTNLDDICNSSKQAAFRLEAALQQVSRFVPTVVCMPTLPLPPMSWTPPAQASTFEMQIHSIVASLAVSLSRRPGLRIVNAQLLSETSPLRGRFEVKSELVTGFPYSLSHASAIGEILATLVYCRAPKKGVITDLDNTLWAGILGDDGVDGISWNLEHQTQVHGLYQQFVSSLAGAGVLIAVASKNDPADVDRAFNRKDLLISRNEIFPFEIHWRRKSESVQHILNIWNVSADSVVFVDDSPMEVAEVQAAFPEMECIVFPNNNNQAAWDLLRHLRDVFGKSFLTEDDSLRLESIRGADSWRDVADSRSTPADDFLEAAEASIVFERVRRSGDLRSLELINKTNQFNLNGKRFGESEWLQVIADPTSFLLTVSYKDKYGPLGKIAVIRGSVIGRTLHVHIWVMSCRAFSRRIEHRCLKYLFDNFGADEIVFEYKETSRNGPLQDFFAELTGKAPVPGVRLSKDSFLVNTPPLFQHVEDAIDV